MLDITRMRNEVPLLRLPQREGLMDFSDICRISIPEGESGPWKVSRFTVPPKDIKALSYALHGRPIPSGTYTRLIRTGDHVPTMSDTPSEIRDHIEPLIQAKQRGGRILMNGLGLGVVLKGFLSFPEVTHVDVVEIDADVIKLVAPSYYDHRVTIYHVDAFEITWPKDTRWSVVWHDIWPSICSDNLPEMTKLHRKYGHKCDWQGSWCRYQCLRQRGTGY